MPLPPAALGCDVNAVLYVVGLETCLLDLLLPWWPKSLSIPAAECDLECPIDPGQTKPWVNVQSSSAASTRWMYFIFWETIPVLEMAGPGALGEPATLSHKVGVPPGDPSPAAGVGT